LVFGLLDNGGTGREVRRRLRRAQTWAPDLIYPEVASAVRRQEGVGVIDSAAAAAAIDDLQDLPIEVHPIGPLLNRMWELRQDVSTYDATYVALAEVLGAPLVTADARLARAPGPRCSVDLVVDPAG
jgi:predicted nucleic acid-binding protein